ncbi:MAG TPA: hypothetical protein VGX71_13600 [Pseudaminobacter sp.]|nr:hypothetical protein [Pseudaminobacter sp.]
MADFGLTTLLSLGATLIGGGVTAAGTIAAGNSQETAAEFQAKQLEQQGKEERAASQREADRVRKERDFILSRQQTVAAASNLGALDETVLDLAGDVSEEAKLQEGLIRYGGEERAKGRTAQAAASRMEGRAAKTGSRFSAAGTIMGTMGSFGSDWARASAAPGYQSSRYA